MSILPAIVNVANRLRENSKMKCQHCEKPATFHITELTDPEGPKVLHLCEEHARVFLASDGASPATALSNMLAKQLKMEKSADDSSSNDLLTCPVCGITFSEFRKGGRLGCAYDYVAFESELEPLLINIHGAVEHMGKSPKNRRGSPERQRQLAQLREDMKLAVQREEYELAGKLRDQIAAIETSPVAQESDERTTEPPSDSFQAETAPPPKKRGRARKADPKASVEDPSSSTPPSDVPPPDAPRSDTPPPDVPLPDVPPPESGGDGKGKRGRKKS